MATATISEKGWVVIPREIRRRYGLKKGDKVHLVDFGGQIAIIPVAPDPIAVGRGMLREGPSMTRALLDERRQELEREEQGLPPLEPDR